MSRDVIIVACADRHVGHIGSVTPPDYWLPENSQDEKVQQIARAQRELWNAYSSFVAEFKNPDVLIENGDLIEGVGERTGGTELWTRDLEVQARVCANLISMFEPKQVIATYGTAYHVSPDGQDVEKIIIEYLRRDGIKARIDSHAFLEVKGKIFDIRHWGGSPQVPTSRGAPLVRERLANLLWAEEGGQKKADVILRAHIHAFFGVVTPNWMGFFQPALLAAMTKYGARRCSFPVDFGIIVFAVSPSGNVAWELRRWKLKANEREPVSIG